MTITKSDEQHGEESPYRDAMIRALSAPVSSARQGRWVHFGIVAVADCLALALAVGGHPVWGLIIAGGLRLLLAAMDIAIQSAPMTFSSGSAASRAIGVWSVALSVILVAGLAGSQADWLRNFPSSRDLFQTISRGIDDLIRYLTLNFGPVFDQIRNFLNYLITTMEQTLGLLPWPVYFLLIGFLAWSRAGWGMLAVVWLCLGYLGIFGYWDKAIVTSALVLTSLVVCMVIGIPLGVAMAKNRFVNAVLAPVLDFMQTLPSFVYLLPAVAFFSIGKPPALMATVIFAMPPLIRLTALGITQVPSYVREALYAHGSSPMQCLLKAEIPLALPSIRTGLNQCIMMSLAMVVIAALIGGGGLGYDVLFALQNVQHGQGLLAGIAIVACAMLFDRIIGRSRH